MKYNKENYVGKRIQLYPGDTYSKWGVIKDVDDIGWTILIDRVSSDRCEYKVGEKIFISHSKNFTFKLM